MAVAGAVTGSEAQGWAVAGVVMGSEAQGSEALGSAGLGEMSRAEEETGSEVVVEMDLAAAGDMSQAEEETGSEVVAEMDLEAAGETGSAVVAEMGQATEVKDLAEEEGMDSAAGVSAAAAGARR